MGWALLINAAEPGQTRVALCHDGRVEVFRCESSDDASLVGNIYRGQVVHLERGIDAAFVDIGVGGNAFLHQSDCIDETLPAKGDTVLAQVTRDSIGSKAPMLTMSLSLPGRYVVFLPRSRSGGVSRRIKGSCDMSRLRAVAVGLERRLLAGLILRTASADCSEKDLVQDAERLAQLWARVEDQARTVAAPALLLAESDLVTRTLRDLAGETVERIIVDTPELFEQARATMRALQPGLEQRLCLHDDPMPLFHGHAIEEQVDELLARRVSLPSGGSLVFDRTEALVAVDVNSGTTRHENGLEETALRTNLEAAEEIARQLRLRDLGGLVIVDFIDMGEEVHVTEVERRFKAHLRADRVHIRPGRLGDFGIFALTRRRYGRDDRGGGRCPGCAGSGIAPRQKEQGLRLWRELRARAAMGGSAPLLAQAEPEVAAAVSALPIEALSAKTGREILVQSVQPGTNLGPAGWRI